MRASIFFLVFILLCFFCACQSQVPELPVPQQTLELQNEETSIEPDQAELPHAVEAVHDSDIQRMDIPTETNYLVNDALPRGNADRIIAKQGAVLSDYPAYDKTHAFIMGADAEKNLYFVDWDDYSLHRLSLAGEDTVILRRLLGNRDNDIYDSILCGSIFAWSECPNASIIPDPDNGAGWLVCFANLDTGEIKIVDQDKDLRPKENTAYPYCCPSGLALTDEYLAYISFEENEQKEIVQALKLYHIPTEEIEIITYLEDDPSCNALGYPSLDGDTLVWCNGYIRPDGLYEGYISYMNLSERAITRLNTEENVLNPHVTAQHIVAESKPNQTFYDSEIVIYDLKKREWIYKINQNASEYCDHANSELNNITCSGEYATWKTSINYVLLVMDIYTGTVFQISEAPSDGLLWNIRLLPGNLLLWDKEHYDPKTGNSQFSLQYAFLK